MLENSVINTESACEHLVYCVYCENSSDNKKHFLLSGEIREKAQLTSAQNILFVKILLCQFRDLRVNLTKHYK